MFFILIPILGVDVILLANDFKALAKNWAKDDLGNVAEIFCFNGSSFIRA